MMTEERLASAIGRLSRVITERAKADIRLCNAIVSCAEMEDSFLLNGLVDGIVEETNKIREAIMQVSKSRVVA